MRAQHFCWFCNTTREKNRNMFLLFAIKTELCALSVLALVPLRLFLFSSPSRKYLLVWLMLFSVSSISYFFPGSPCNLLGVPRFSLQIYNKVLQKVGVFLNSYALFRLNPQEKNRDVVRTTYMLAYVCKSTFSFFITLLGCAENKKNEEVHNNAFYVASITIHCFIKGLVANTVDFHFVQHPTCPILGK